MVPMAGSGQRSLIASRSVIRQVTAPELCSFSAGTSQTWNVLEDPVTEMTASRQQSWLAACSQVL